jgi:HipA-like C-terminal domain
MVDLDTFLSELARRRVVRAAELRSALGISPATLSRLVSKAGDRVLRLGRGTATSYSRTRLVEGLGRRLPIFRIDEEGRSASAGTLHMLAEGQHWWESPRGGQLFTGLPPALADMAPQGYLGHGFAARFPELALPPRLGNWSDDHRLIALARRGEDCVGDLVVGDESLARALSAPLREVEPADYPQLAERSATDVGGSSAGGERPKFGAFSGGRHVLVKFASGETSATACRWRDLLWCEWKALELVAAAGVPASSARLLDVDGWRFLEVERFDRVGPRGRRAVVSLGAIDNEYLGLGGDWIAVVAQLVGPPFLLSPEDRRRVRWLDTFGQLIGNNDRHPGNLAFLATPEGSLRLAPSYDMLPMILAPSAETLVTRRFEPAPPTGATIDVWPDAAEWARRFWSEVEAESRLDGAVRGYAGEAGAAVTALARRVVPGQA